MESLKYAGRPLPDSSNLIPFKKFSTTGIEAPPLGRSSMPAMRILSGLDFEMLVTIQRSRLWFSVELFSRSRNIATVFLTTDKKAKTSMSSALPAIVIVSAFSVMLASIRQAGEAGFLA
jgi:hypothetical protein